MENTRALSLAQQETAVLAQLLKARQEAHDKEVQGIASRASEHAARSRATAEEMARVRSEMEQQMREQEAKLAQIQQQSDTAVRDLGARLGEVESAASSHVRHHVAVGVAQDIAVSAASAAAKEAIREVLQYRDGKADLPQPDAGEQDVSYRSDFDSSTTTTTTLHAAAALPCPEPASDHTPTRVDGEMSLASVPESITPVPSEKVRSADDERESNEEVEEDINEVYTACTDCCTAS